VHRFVVNVCPAPDHPEYYAWQTAQCCIFVGDDDRRQAFETARKEIERHRWLPIGTFRKETLIPERIQKAPDEVRKAYEEAKKGRVSFHCWPDQMPIAKKGKLPLFRAPRIGEAFIDKVILRAGGTRLATAGGNRSADYALDNTVIELKDLQGEGLLVPTRHSC
jgi:hypothetical protein